VSPPAPAGAGAGPVLLAGSPAELWEKLTAETASGRRFAGLMATQRPGGLVLSAHLAGTGGIATHETVLPSGAGSYPALTPVLGAAFWYEREIHDLFGVVPAGHPRLEQLILELLIGRRGSLYGLELVTASRGRLKRGTVYVTLARMEDKGFVTSRQEEAPADEGGLPRRLRSSRCGSRPWPTRHGATSLPAIRFGGACTSCASTNSEGRSIAWNCTGASR